MFDRIHFITVNQDYLTLENGTSVASQEILNEAKSGYSDSVRHSLSEIDIINPEGHSEFLLDCSIKTLRIFPVSDLIRQSYCWLQSFGWAQSGPKYFTRRSHSPSYLIMYTYSGQGSLLVRDNQYTLHPGEGFFVDCQEFHEYRTVGDHWEHLDLHIAGPMIDPIYEEYKKTGSPIFTEPMQGPLQAYFEQVARICDHPAPYREFQLSGVLYSIAVYLLTRTVSATHADQSIIQNIQYLIRYIDNHYTDKMNLDFLAKFSGISKYYLSREFHRYTGFPPNEYIIQRRIYQAQILLASSDAPVQQIAEDVGFSGVQHFSRQFHRVVGMSPSAYRNMFRDTKKRAKAQ